MMGENTSSLHPSPSFSVVVAHRLANLGRHVPHHPVRLQVDHPVPVVLDDGRGLGVEGRQAGFQRFSVVILAPGQGLARHVVHAGDFGRRELVVVGPTGGGVDEAARDALDLTGNGRERE